MIGWLSGILRHKQPPLLLLDVHGVGYEVEAPMTTFYELPAVGQPVTLFAHQVVREDAQQLFGFLLEQDRALFRMLIKTNGVGPKLALAILSGMNRHEFASCVHSGDGAALTRLPGVGRKTADRLIVEMRDRLEGDAGATAHTGGTGAGMEPAGGDPVSDAVNALVTLGYKPQEASRRVRAVTTEGVPCEDIIRQALKASGA